MTHTVLIDISNSDKSLRYIGAGDGNRTHMTSLEGWSSTTELHPHTARPGVFGGLSSLPLNQRYLLYHYKSLLSSTFLYFFHLNSTLCNFTYLFFLCCFILFTITSLNKKPTIPATRATPSTTSTTVKLPLFTLLPKIVESIIAGSLQGMT